MLSQILVCHSLLQELKILHLHQKLQVFCTRINDFDFRDCIIIKDHFTFNCCKAKLEVNKISAQSSFTFIGFESNNLIVKVLDSS
jgi:hypothetical protein